MSTRKPIPQVAPCPCGECCLTAYSDVANGECDPKWRVITACGFEGPPRRTKRAAREAWNRRSDAEAERRGAIAAVDMLVNLEFKHAAAYLKTAIARGKVLPVKAKKGARKR